MVTTEDIIKIRKPKPRNKLIKEIALRWSPRFFSDKKIPENHLARIFEAARFTPSGRNHQPWYFYYAIKGSVPYRNLFSALSLKNRLWAKTAPVLVLGCAIVKNEFGENPFALYDLGAAVISLILQAQNLGYYARQMGMFDKGKIKSELNLGENFEPFIITALGKLGNYQNAPKEITDLDIETRPRKTEIFRKL